jgi:type IV pilus assembly protein PilC
MAKIYDEFGAQLPVFTTYVFGITAWLANYLWILVALLLVFITTLRFINGTMPGTSKLNDLNYWIALHLPGFGRLYRTLEVIRSLHAWQFMLAHNASLQQAIAASMQVVQMPVYAKALSRIHSELNAGGHITETLQQQRRWFPEKVSHTLLVATRNAQSSYLLTKLANRYEQNIRVHFDQHHQLFTIIVAIILWVIIGSMIIASYLPIFQFAIVL